MCRTSPRAHRPVRPPLRGRPSAAAITARPPPPPPRDAVSPLGIGRTRSRAAGGRWGRAAAVATATGGGGGPQVGRGLARPGAAVGPGGSGGFLGGSWAAVGLLWGRRPSPLALLLPRCVAGEPRRCRSAMGDVLAYEAELLGLVREVGVRLFSLFSTLFC